MLVLYTLEGLVIYICIVLILGMIKFKEKVKNIFCLYYHLYIMDLLDILILM